MGHSIFDLILSHPFIDISILFKPGSRNCYLIFLANRFRSSILTTFPDPLRMTTRDSNLSYGDGSGTSSRDTEISPPLRSLAANSLNCELLPRNSISPVVSLRTSDSTRSPLTPKISTADNLQARTAPAESASVEIGGSVVCGFFTSWGDGAFPVRRDLADDGTLCRLRVEVGAPEIVERQRKLDDRWFGELSLATLATARVARGDAQVRWMYRQEPANPRDSGWRVFAGNETDSEANDPANVAIIPLPDFRWWAMDLVSPLFTRWANRIAGRRLSAAGASFQFAPEDGPGFFRPLGWEPAEIRSSWLEQRRLGREPGLMRAAWALSPPRRRNAYRDLGLFVLLRREPGT